MPDLLIRKLPKALHRTLKARAARAGRSMSEEAVSAIRHGLAVAGGRRVRPGAAERLQAIVRDMYGGSPPKGVVDDLIAERRREAAGDEDEWRKSKA